MTPQNQSWRLGETSPRSDALGFGPCIREVAAEPFQTSTPTLLWDFSSRQGHFIVVMAAPMSRSAFISDGKLLRRSNSNNSTTSSDIVVAPAQPLVEVKDGRVLIVRLSREKLQSALQPNNDDSDDEDGRNARGTFSRDYTLRHPEIKWVHRGQGRYLPAEEVKRQTAAEPVRRSRYVFSHISRSSNKDATI